MKTRSLLVYAPGFPFRFEALLPQRGLGAMAGALASAGHWTRAFDYGSVRALRRFASPGLRAMMRQVSDPRETYHGLCSLPSLVEECRRRRSEMIARDIFAAGELDFVVFLVKDRRSLRDALEVGELVAAHRPGLRLAAAGSYIDVYGALVLAGTDVFDCCLVGDCETGVTALAETAAAPERWKHAPNILYWDGSGVRQGPWEDQPSLDSLPRPVYDRDAYPALHAGGKLRLFTVEQSRGQGYQDHRSQGLPWRDGELRVKTASTLCDELAALGISHGLRAVHIAGAATPPMQALRLASELQARGMSFEYSRSGSVYSTDPSALQELARSGCRAIDFRIDTGSQRLLEDFYGQAFGVSQAESVLRAAREAELFTVVKLSYPCPQDDYHSFEETMRILRRCRPAAALLSLPAVLPGSPWYLRARDFGFTIDYRFYARYASLSRGASRASGPCAGPRSREMAGPPYRMAGWPRLRCSTARAAMAEEAERLQITMGTSLLEGMAARLAGYAGEERRFHEAVEHCLHSFDCEGLERLVNALNDAATVPVNTVAFRPFRPLPAAVGN